MDNVLISILLVFVGVVVGVVAVLITNYFKETSANKKAEQILEKARRDADKSKRESVLEAK